MKKIKFLTFCLLIAAFTIFSACFISGEEQVADTEHLSEDQPELVQISEKNITYSYLADYENGHAALVKIESSEKEIFIPARILYNEKEYIVDRIDKYAVVCPNAEYLKIESEGGSIDDEAFKSHEKLKKVEITGIEHIGVRAFQKCLQIESVYISSHELILDEASFAECRALRELTIQADAVNLGRDSFQSCTELKKFICLCEEISFEDNVFQECIKLTDVQITGKVMKLESSAFYRCGMESVTINAAEGCYIGAGAFSNCSELKSVIITGPVKEIQNSAFTNCMLLKNVELDEGLEIIGSGAFSECRAIENIILPSTVFSIESRAFYDCTSLKSIVFNDGVQIIGEEAFRNCCSLKEIFLPDTLNELGDRAFTGCGSLKYVTINGNNDVIIGKNAFSNAFASEVHIKMPLSSREYLDTSGISRADEKIYIHAVIPKDTQVIEDKAFKGCTNIVEIIFNEKITRIGNESFMNCSSIYSLIIPSSVTNIGYEAFSGCSELRSIIIPSSVESIGYSAFSNTFKLKSACFMHEDTLPSMPDLQEYGIDSIFYSDKPNEYRVYIRNSEYSEMWNQVSDRYFVYRGVGNLIVFDPNGGIPDELFRFVEDGMYICPPKTPTHAEDGLHYEFSGWYVEDEEFEFSDPIAQDLMLTAKWKVTEQEESSYETAAYIILTAAVLIIILAAAMIYLRKKRLK